MQRKFMTLFAIIAIIMMTVGCPQDTNTDNETPNNNPANTQSTQAEQNKATSGIAANMTIKGVIEDTTCDIILDAATATWTASESRSKSFAGEFFYDNGKLQLKVTKKDEVILPTNQQVYLKSEITENDLKDQVQVTLITTKKEVYEEAKTEYRKSVESVSGSSFTVVLEDIPAEAKAVALFCNQNEFKAEKVNGSSTYIADVVNGKAVWTITNYQLSEPFEFQITPLPNKDTKIGDDWWSYAISGSSQYSKNKNNITCDFAKKKIEYGGFTITINKTTYSTWKENNFPLYGINSNRLFNESYTSCFTVKFISPVTTTTTTNTTIATADTISFTVVLEDVTSDAAAVALYCNANDSDSTNINGSSQWIAEVIDGKATWRVTNYQSAETFKFQFVPMPSKYTELGEDWWSYAISGSSQYSKDKNYITCDFESKGGYDGCKITVNNSTYGFKDSFPLYEVNSTRWFNENWKSCFTVE